MIHTFSKFIYGTSMDATNNNGDFKESGGALLATVEAGPYTLGELCEAVADALTAAGGQTYTVTYSRTTGLVTISAAGTFQLLLGSGANRLESYWEILGFTQGSDQTGTNTYTGASRAGTEYYPQFMLQSYVGPDNYKQAIDPTVNRTSSGRTELVSFGTDEMIEMDIKFITNLPMDGVVIKNNPTGLTDAVAFFDDITLKSRFEFVPDIATPGTFHKVVLESMPNFKDGSGYKLKELFMQNLPDIYETGLMQLRVVS
jgi:hypothetical protein